MFTDCVIDSGCNVFVFSDYLFLNCLDGYCHIYSNKKVMSDFHGTISFNPVKMSQQK